ncbi:GNAT family N-acetyltransferase [Actinoallomurus spadix]|uniref:GNAT family N-acetyltransferase n=1 Tax=Actinoallomurus spadix TaxID=79912 RepID=A0ABP3FPJ7_9ACTN|nr:GNAT family N-acetyltransferase [Actinoallomurus spadix]MCO5988148.1 GNAT family N-acetyltransferase [Actinoallomurus spadix]
MGWITTGDIAQYDATAGHFLRSRPVENTVLVTVLESLRARGLTAYGNAPAVMGSFISTGCVAGAFVHTPPFPLLLSAMPDQAVIELAKTLAADGRRLPGVTGRHELAEIFADRWRLETGSDFKIWERRRLYRLEEVRTPEVPGRARLAGPADRDLLLGWYQDAEREIRERPGDHGAAVDDRIAYGGLTVWERDGVPVALAGRTRMVAGTVRIAPVYTPPEHRRHGYGAAVTAAVGRAAVEAGAEEVVVFADLANPGINAIHRRIGFQPLDDYLVISFGTSRRGS